MSCALGGLSAVTLGLLYANYAFGPTEAEAAAWGRIAIALGATQTMGTAIWMATRSAALRTAVALVAGAITLIQLPPIGLWLVFHGSGISDGTPPSSFVAHWAYALPHVIVAALCIGAVLACARQACAPTKASDRGDTNEG
jgi:hypothetical protein